MTAFVMFAFVSRDMDNPSIRGRSTDNFEQRMEIFGATTSRVITSVQKDNMLLEIYEMTNDKENDK